MGFSGRPIPALLLTATLTGALALPVRSSAGIQEALRCRMDALLGWMRQAPEELREPSRPARQTERAEPAPPAQPVLRVLAVPQGVLPEFASPIAEAFAAGPLRWIEVTPLPEEGRVNRFVRGCSEGSAEAHRILAGYPSRKDRSVARIGSQETGSSIPPSQADSFARAWGRPLAIQGATDQSLFTPSYGTMLPEEAYLPQGTSFGSRLHDVRLTRLGLFYGKTLDGPRAYAWAREFLALHDELARNGMRIDPATRGARFVQALRAALEGVDPEHLRLLERWDEVQKLYKRGGQTSLSGAQVTEVWNAWRALEDYRASHPDSLERVLRVLEEFRD